MSLVSRLAPKPFEARLGSVRIQTAFKSRAGQGGAPRFPGASQPRSQAGLLCVVAFVCFRLGMVAGGLCDLERSPQRGLFGPSRPSSLDFRVFI